MIRSQPPVVPALPARAQAIDDIFDFIDLLFAVLDLFNAVLETIRNIGDFINGN